ncbi:hypothetical protein PR003_g20641 [Phytophthora rubi]|uniref:Uncharacterized protein n=1 Tax=Phytophthora rubi TaxID=129364 RepID=A0A6A3KKR9_9STRA|nr:hypothetical protein PR001_g17746 [Phytophthora rubi]KAE9308872.1 hypothetical protein PR003_g20641 [Phytophthora rubi]
MPRGRPRTLPSSLPRLSPEVVLDPELQHVEIQSRQAMAQEASARRRLHQQERVAEDHARQRGKRQIEELTMAYKHAQLAAEKTSKKLERLAQKKAEQQRQLDRYASRLKAVSMR